MNKRAQIFCLIVIISFSPVLPFISTFASSNVLYAATLRCAKCGRKISGRFLKDGKGKPYCSKWCYEKSLPKCAVCRRPASIVSGKKHFCSKRCLKTTWPKCTSCKKRVRGGVSRGDKRVFLCSKCAAKPKCFSCHMPANHGTFSDGRGICKLCSKSSVTDLDRVIVVAEEVRALMNKKLNLSTNHNINYKIVSLDELQSRSTHNSKGMELGLYLFEQVIEKRTTTKTFAGRTSTKSVEKVKSESHTIFLLYGIPENKLREVAAHELTHDWMQSEYPLVDDLKVKEGCSEYVASMVNSLYGRSSMNKRMQLNRDPIYGGGYRKIKKLLIGVVGMELLSY